MSMDPKLQIVNDNRLGCPVCGGEYLHHGRVIVKNRCEDSDGTIVDIEHERATVYDAKAREFEGRRSSVWIEMSCEHCALDDTGPRVVGWIGIEQHKGTTIVEWQENAPMGVDE